MATKKVNHDQKILDFINEVKLRKAEIARAEKPNWLTNCSFSYNENCMSGAINIHVLSSVKELAIIAGYIKDKERAYKLGCDAISLVGDFPAFTWQGFKVEEWMEDIKTRVNKIQIASKKSKLEQLEARLNAIITPELRAQMELEAIASELS